MSAAPRCGRTVDTLCGAVQLAVCAVQCGVGARNTMMANPRKGQTVRVWYKKSLAAEMPLHGKIGTVEIVSKGKPRNHGIRIDGALWVVPCGNLQKVEQCK